ncbi:MAG: DUF1499 domain-containing protein [Devosia sp.]
MRILVRTSKWAVWSRRFGALALPLAVLPVFLHRMLFLESTTFEIVEAVALGVATIAFILGLAAMIRLWITGDQGWGRASLGLVFGALCLAPAFYLAVEAVRIQATPDVSTDYANPPALVSFAPSRFIGPEERARIEADFPNVRSRTYPVTAPQMFTLVENLAASRGWEMRARRVPVNALDTGQLNAVATTLLGWRHEVAIRVAGTADGSTVDMRSAVLTDFHDFAENGQRIEAFLLELDNQVTLLLRDAPVAPVADDS